MKIRYVFLILEIFFLILFLLPFYKNIGNIGSAAGAVLCSVLILITVFFDQFSSLIKSLWHTAAGKTALIILSAVIAFGIALCSYFSVRMIAAMNNRPDKETTVVVLGCKVNGENPSKMLRFRLNAAYEYLKENENIKCIVSGGQGHDEIMPEADAMFNYLVEKGISPDRIYKERNSNNTYENIKFSKKIIDENSLPSDMTIVTSEFHEYRASIIADKQGIKTYSVPAGTLWWDIPTYWLREWMGLFEEIFLK